MVRAGGPSPVAGQVVCGLSLGNHVKADRMIATSAVDPLTTTEHDEQMVPPGLLPRWKDVPALAWLVTRRLGGSVVRVRILGPLACSAGWWLTLASLAGFRAERRCAATGRTAVVAMKPRWPARLRWRYWVAVAAVQAVALLAVVGVPGLIIVLASLARGGLVGPFELGLACVPSVAMAGLIGLVVAPPALRSIASRDRRVAREWARDTETVLIEAVMLAADERDRQAATVLTLRLRRLFHHQRVAIIARPASDDVAQAYRRIGFVPLRNGSGRILLRLPPGTLQSSSRTG